MQRDWHKVRHVRRINQGGGPWRGLLAACLLATAGLWLLASDPVRFAEPYISLGLAGGLAFFGWWIAYGWARPGADDTFFYLLIGAAIGAGVTALGHPPWSRVSVDIAVQTSIEAGARVFALVALVAAAEDAWRDLRAFWGPVRADEARANGSSGAS